VREQKNDLKWKKFDVMFDVAMENTDSLTQLEIFLLLNFDNKIAEM